MLKVNGMSIEEVAHTIASTVGAVEQDARRPSERLRRLLGRTPSEQPEALGDVVSAAGLSERAAANVVLARGPNSLRLWTI